MENREDFFGKNLLIAGMTGSGKSAFMEALVIELAERYTPTELRLLILDPKRVQFAPYKKLPHLLQPVVFSVEEGMRALEKIGQEALARVRDLNHTPRSMITVVIDEVADCMVADAPLFEGLIEKITSVSAATHIFVVLATSRPDGVHILTERLRRCFPFRLSFRIKHPDDSLVVLGDPSATTLTEPGMAYLRDMETGTLSSIQVPHMTEEERRTRIHALVATIH